MDRLIKFLRQVHIIVVEALGLILLLIVAYHLILAHLKSTMNELATKKMRQASRPSWPAT